MTDRLQWMLAGWLCLCLAGCPDAKKTTAPTGGAELPFSNQLVGLAVPTGMGFRQNWEGPLTEWQAQTGAKIDLAEYEPGEANEPLARYSAGSDRTLVVFPLDRLGELIDADVLAPIPTTALNDVEGLNWLDVFPGLREGLASPRRRPTVAPLSCPVLLCYYRRDLLEQAGLRPPQTWDDYQKLLDGLAGWAPGLTAVEPWGPDFRATMFLARSLAFVKHPGSYSVFFDIETARPLIDGAGFVRALESAQKSWPRLAADYKDLTPADCRGRILRGEAAIAIACEPEAGATSDTGTDPADRTDERIRVGMCRLPGSRDTYDPARGAWDKPADQTVNHVTLVGFSGWGCAASSRRSVTEIDAAWNAISRIGSDGFVQSFPPGITGLCRESQGPNSLDIGAASLRGDEAGLCLAAIGQSLRDPRQVIELPVPQRREFRAALSEAIHAVMEGRAAPDEGLKTAAESWKQLANDVGAERLRNAYRAALGLSAR